MKLLQVCLIFTAVGMTAWLLVHPLAAVLLVAASALYQIDRNERQLRRLTSWAGQPPGTPLPEAEDDSWSLAFAALHRRARQAAAHREELRELGERFRLAAEALPDGVMILDAGNVMEWMNTRAASLFGLDAQRDVGMPVTHLLREPEFVAFMQRDHGSDDKPLLMRPMRNPTRTLHVRAAPFSAGRKLLLGEDLTQLQRLENVRRDFVANVSHELRTPLTVVQGFIETVRDTLAEQAPPAQEEVIGHLELALQHARRMQQLIEDLLVLTALESGPRGADLWFDAGDVVAEVAREAQALAAGRHEIEVHSDADLRLLGDRSQVRSAFSNLVSNAVRYTPDGGRIEITLKRREDRDVGAEFCVSDNGIGIEQRHIGRLTERFYRVDHGRSRASGGTGLGLAIVKHVLERHDARLEVDSSPGVGSRFSVLLPPARVGLADGGVSA